MVCRPKHEKVVFSVLTEVLKRLTQESLDIKPYSNHIVQVICNTCICICSNDRAIATVQLRSGRIVVWCHSVSTTQTLGVAILELGDPEFLEPAIHKAIDTYYEF